ncbi:MAG: dienelactone hydrolase family protein [Parachlamydia sp.]|jgi:dienelactone hydrolase|nr:dienelactone hydrolase family protein [Parachlamydia sp.]
MDAKELTYRIENDQFKGYLVYPQAASEKQAPAILVAPTWLGRNEFACQKAQALAELGYIALAVDYYGNGKVASGADEAASLVKPLFKDRARLQGRIQAAYEALKEQPHVSADKIGGIGFCFGGLTIIELLRSGVPLKGVVSFHGVLGSRLAEVEANLVPIAKKVEGSLLVLHGYHDPLVTNEDILNLEKEMTEAGVDWQFNTYGLAGHSFTNSEQKNKESGLFYEPLTSKRAWQAMQLFFNEVFH